MPALTSHHSLPPFPSDVETAPLVSISLAKLEAGDTGESAAFFEACKRLGFFYLDMIGSSLGETIVSEAEELNMVQKEFFKLPNSVKDVYGRPHLHPFYAYRYNEVPSTDGSSPPLRNFENYNVSTCAGTLQQPSGLSTVTYIYDV
jgi:isopenicillin N synthase-like dioxygenase